MGEDFSFIFNEALKRTPYPYQTRLANIEQLPSVLEVPTGMGKTAAVVMSWYYRRRCGPIEIRKRTPRRLVIVLPTRSLVEQTEEAIVCWLHNLKVLGGTAQWSEYGGHKLISYSPDKSYSGQTKNKSSRFISIYKLMGGDVDEGLDLWPEDDAIIVGTQDMILSRALNRGYAMSRFRWPIHYALLNNDALWVLDEVQLMGVGLETSCQLDGLRKKMGTIGPTNTIWMSATMVPERMGTVDHIEPHDGWSRIGLDEGDMTRPEIAKLVTAKKPLAKSHIILSGDEKKYAKNLAKRLVELHSPGTLTLCILNNVVRAQNVFRELQKVGRTPQNSAVIHSRFRGQDRKAGMSILLNADDRIVVTTQVVEAGVDVSANKLVTELASWNSMVQRFGRCNRRGDLKDAAIEYIDIKSKKAELLHPYSIDEIHEANLILASLSDGGSKSLDGKISASHDLPRPVIRRKDILELFDTTPDLLGNDLDISRYVRDGEDTDVHVYWREFNEEPDDSMAPSQHEEMCPVPIGEIRKFLENKNGWVWDYNDGGFIPIGKISKRNARPGQIILLNSMEGGYSSALGWVGVGESKPVAPIMLPMATNANPHQESLNDDRISKGPWIGLTEHLTDVQKKVSELANAVVEDANLNSALVTAAKWHDVGKAHAAFQCILGTDDLHPGLWGKSPNVGNRIVDSNCADTSYSFKRKYFRHELASALAWVKVNPLHPNLDLIAYLIAAHHGKVRLSIRSIPGEKEPSGNRLFARGVWDGDVIPEISGIISEPVSLNLGIMQMGEGSWTSKILSLRDDPDIGPFRLAYLESILRIGDWRASAEEEHKEVRDELQ